MKVTIEEYKNMKLDELTTGEIFIFRDNYYMKMNRANVCHELDVYMNNYIPAVDIITGEFIKIKEDVVIEVVDDYKFTVKRY